MKKIILSMLFIIVVFSCDPLNEPVNNIKYSMIGNLVVNANQQEMYIYNTIALNDLNWISGGSISSNKYLAKNAKIIVKNEENTSYSYMLNLDTNVYYYTSSFKPKPLNRYTLKISINGDELNGETISPGDFSIISPLPNQHFTQVNDTIKIPTIWNASKNSFGYKVSVFSNYNVWNNYSGRYSREISFITQDTSFIYEEKTRGRSIYRIEIMAFDKNFYEHIIQKIPSAGIKGAYGYFGSSVLKSITIKIN